MVSIRPIIGLVKECIAYLLKSLFPPDSIGLELSPLYLKRRPPGLRHTYLQKSLYYLLSFLFLLAILLLISARVRAEIYTYIDENGTIHFSNVPTDPQYRMIIPPKEEKGKIKNKVAQKELTGLIEEKAFKYGLDPALVKAIIAVESDFDPYAVSVKGARGLMQLMPMTAYELGVVNSFDPEANIEGGVRYLRYLLDYFNWDIDLALAAYNAGIMSVTNYSGIPPYPETMRYVDKVKRFYRRYILQ